MPRNPYYSGPPSDHFDGVRFFLPGGRSTDKSRRDLLRWRFQSRELPAWPSAYSGLPQDKPPPRVHGAALRVAFVGHATFLIQTQGVNLLVDPVWSERASPLRFAGPKRVNPPGIDFDDLPPLDAILLTHNHYDHMDMATLKRLAHQRPCPIVTPLGNDTILARGIAKVDARAYDWGDVARIGPLAVHLVPAQHWSARGLFDRRMALWCGFVIETAVGKIYVAGDTGYGDGRLFRDIFLKHGAMRLALLPIGAYEPRWFMREQHVDPEESVRMFEDVDAGQALGCHWGTFRLTDEAIDEPLKRLAVALERAGIAPERFRAARPGEVLEIA
ncbi:MAG: MBL fold metallo-hydrolase [Hyphomicrobiales bacterium]|nr:MBL fold metallo-hydrolase [Hyphomicrobiales bacterium]